MEMDGFKKTLVTYGGENPFKLFALVSFSVLGAIPVLVFSAYVIATLVAILIGAVVVELLLLGAGITCLAFVLFFVTCITLCVTSVFGAVLLSYRVASNTLGSSRLPFRLTRRSAWPHGPSPNTSSGELRGGEGDVDKTK